MVNEPDTDPRPAYLEWLFMEARLLRIELYGREWADREGTPCNTFARAFHFPADQKWDECEQPSARAVRVMQAAGVEVPA